MFKMRSLLVRIAAASSVVACGGSVESPTLVSREGCMETWKHPGGLPGAVDPNDGFSAEECRRICSSNDGDLPTGEPTTASVSSCSGPKIDPGRSGAEYTVTCFTCVAGRRHEGYTTNTEIVDAATWLAQAADLETASELAFRILESELAFHHAPEGLLRRCALAREDEIRHERLMGDIATPGPGSRPPGPVARAPRSLLEIAVENMVEGCVRETFGALMAYSQSVSAHDLRVRAVMAEIFPDEAEHAELSLAIHGWATSRLSDREREEVAAAGALAVEQLARAINTPLAGDASTALGLPSPRLAAQMVRELQANVWAPLLAA